MWFTCWLTANLSARAGRISPASLRRKAMTGSAEAVPLAKTDYRAAFESFLKARKGRESAWLSSMRSEAFQNFARLGFPSRDHEEWRYTDVGPIVDSAFRFQFEPVPGREAISLGKLELGHKDWH